MQPISTNIGFSINKIQRYVLYIASIILIFSLFFDTKIVSNAIVQKGSFAFVVIGLFWWVIEEIINTVLAYTESNECKWKEESKKFASIFLTGLWFAFLIVGILLGVSLIFPRFLSIMSVWG